MAKKMTSTNRVRSVSLDIGAKESRGVGWADGAFRGVDAGLSSPGKDCSTGWPQVNAKMGRLWPGRGQPRRRCPGKRSREAANSSPGRSDEPRGWLRAASSQSAQGSAGLPSDHLDRARGPAGKGRGLIPRKSSGRPINFRGT